MGYDRAAQAFIGAVENTKRAYPAAGSGRDPPVDGVELGPTTPNDLAAGKAMPVRLDAARGSGAQFFGCEGGGEHGSGGERGGEHGLGGERSSG